MQHNILTGKILINLHFFSLIVQKRNNVPFILFYFILFYVPYVSFVVASALQEDSQIKGEQTDLRPRLILVDYYIQSDLRSLERPSGSHGTII